MPRVMFRCPATGKPVYTGIDMDKKSFDAATFQGQIFGPCPECQNNHQWDKKNAYLEEEENK